MGRSSVGGVTHRLENLLGIEHSILLGPFGGVSSVELTAAVSELGGLGQYGLYGYGPTASARPSPPCAPPPTSRSG